MFGDHLLLGGEVGVNADTYGRDGRVDAPRADNFTCSLGVNRRCGYRSSSNAQAIVKKPTAVSSTLWPQRAIGSSMMSPMFTDSARQSCARTIIYPRRCP